MINASDKEGSSTAPPRRRRSDVCRCACLDRRRVGIQRLSRPDHHGPWSPVLGSGGRYGLFYARVEMSRHSVRFCRLESLTPGAARRFDVEGLLIAVVRIGDDVYAIGDRCTHQNVSLSEGEVREDDRLLECWKHGSQFSLLTGEPIQLPAFRPTPVYPVSIDAGEVVVTMP